LISFVPALQAQSLALKLEVLGSSIAEVQAILPDSSQKGEPSIVVFQTKTVPTDATFHPRPTSHRVVVQMVVVQMNYCTNEITSYRVSLPCEILLSQLRFLKNKRAISTNLLCFFPIIFGTMPLSHSEFAPKFNLTPHPYTRFASYKSINFT
jgi:hypothetical protein